MSDITKPTTLNDGIPLRVKLFSGFPGCSDHNCIVRGKQQGMGTNGGCKCLVDASRSQLHILQSRLNAVMGAEVPNGY